MTALNLQATMESGIGHHQAGRLQEAEVFYRQVLASQPTHSDALHLLGMIARQTGRNEMAADLVRQAIAVQPNTPDYHLSLGLILRSLGQIEGAITSLRQAIALRPNYPEAVFNLGNALKIKGQLADAISAYQQAISLRPDYPEVFNNLGNTFRQLGQIDQAIDSYRKAIAIRGTYPEAHNNLGAALRDKGELAGSIRAYRQALAFRANYSEAQHNLASALQAAGQLTEAIAAYQQASLLQPGNAEILFHLAMAHQEAGQIDEAIRDYQQVLVIAPNHADACFRLGTALVKQGQIDQAMAWLRKASELGTQHPESYYNLGTGLLNKGDAKEAIIAFHAALKLKPDYPEAWSNLGNALAEVGQASEAIEAYQAAIRCKQDFAGGHFNHANTLMRARRVDEAIAAFRAAIHHDPELADAYINLSNALKDVGELDPAIEYLRDAMNVAPDNPLAHSNYAFTLHFTGDYDSKAIYEEHLRWNQRHAQPLRKLILPQQRDRMPDRRLRIGYVSADFREHPVARFLMPLLEHRDHSQFEVYCYAFNKKVDAFTQCLTAMSDVWRPVHDLSEEESAEMIRKDQIDILVDLAMHTFHKSLLVFARKPAPVQVTYLAYCSTTGLDAIDYRITDPYLDAPESDTSCYSEQSIWLKESYWCYQAPPVPIQVNALPALSTGKITFGCLNNFCKISSSCLACWSSLLKAIPDSSLLLHSYDGSHRQKLKTKLEEQGIAPDRIKFVGHLPMPQYLALYQQMDIALDPFPYNGGTTSCDALWMGVPVISLAGNLAVSRAGLSILSNIGLPELVARSEEKYIQIAKELAGDLNRLTQLRVSLREKMTTSPLMDAKGFAGNMESLYREIWKKWCASGK